MVEFTDKLDKAFGEVEGAKGNLYVPVFRAVEGLFHIEAGNPEFFRGLARGVGVVECQVELHEWSTSGGCGKEAMLYGV